MKVVHSEKHNKTRKREINIYIFSWSTLVALMLGCGVKFKLPLKQNGNFKITTYFVIKRKIMQQRETK